MPSVDQPDFTLDDLTDLDLTCPACSANLTHDDTFLVARVCGTCHRHFSMSARERIGLLADPGSFAAFTAPEWTGLDGLAPELIPSAERLAESRDRLVLTEAVVTGTIRIGGIESVIVVLDDHFVGSSMGATLVEKIVEALGQAIARKLPIVLVCTGGARAPAPGPLSVVQPARLASAFAQAHVAGLPVIGILVHPVAASIHAMLAAHTDVLFAEPGTRVGSMASPLEAAVIEHGRVAEELLVGGWIDAVVDRLHLREGVARTLDVLVNAGEIHPDSPTGSRWAQGNGFTQFPGMAAAPPERPDARVMQAALLSDVVELRGDRASGDVPGVAIGFGRLESLAVAWVLLTDEARSDYAGAARKVARLARFASRLQRPVLMVIDEGSIAADSEVDVPANQAIASLGTLLAVLPVPLVAVALDQVASPLALALFAADRQFLLANARLMSGGTSSGTGPGAPRLPHLATRGGQYLSARECELLGLVDGIIGGTTSESPGDYAGTIHAARLIIGGGFAELVGIGSRRLLDTRFRRQRQLGLSTPDGLAAARSELWEIHEWQRSVGRSIDDLRERWDQFRSGTPRGAGRRIEVPDLVARLRTRRQELLNRAARADRGLEAGARDEAVGPLQER